MHLWNGFSESSAGLSHKCIWTQTSCKEELGRDIKLGTRGKITESMGQNESSQGRLISDSTGSCICERTSAEVDEIRKGEK